MRLSSIEKLPEASGVYLFSDEKGTVIYIGKAKNLKKRVSSYFRENSYFDSKIAVLVKKIKKISFIRVESEFEALLLEAKLINKIQPKYNTIWKDDKHYIYVKITAEEFPRILFSRKEDDPQATFFGPFPSSRVTREILTIIRKIFPYCNQNRNIKKPCFYTHIGLCNPCPAYIMTLAKKEQKIKKRDYLTNIKQIKMLLAGKLSKIEKHLKKEMKRYSEKNEFEKAALFKNRLQNLYYLTQDYHPSSDYLENPKLFIDLREKEEKELVLLLSPYFPHLRSIKRIECYDISDIFGKQAAGSMVVFINGEAEKKLYRHFRIKLKNTPDDVAMIGEVIKRRLLHKEWNMPDLLVVDGGKPQLSNVIKILQNFKIKIPVIGLAKEYEEIIVAHNQSFQKIRPPKDNCALHLLQRIRDEAHRFAKNYHEVLRLKNLFSQ